MGGTVDRIDLRRCVGPASLVDLGERGRGAAITLADFLPYESAIGATVLTTVETRSIWWTRGAR